MLRKAVFNKKVSGKYFSTFTNNSGNQEEELPQRLLLMSSPEIIQQKDTQNCGPVAIAQMINWVTPIKFPFMKFVDVSQFLFNKKWLGKGEMAGENELPGFTLAFSKICTNSTPLVRLDVNDTSLFHILSRNPRCQVACVVGSHFIVVHYNKSYGESDIYVSGLWDRGDKNFYTKPKKMSIVNLYEFLRAFGMEPRVVAVFVPKF